MRLCYNSENIQVCIAVKIPRNFMRLYLMQIGNSTNLPNPSQLERLTDVVAIDIDALGGTKRLKIEGDQLIFKVRFQWDGLTRAQQDALVTALTEASRNYVLVDCPALGGITGSTTLAENQMYMTLLPGSKPAVQWLPEYADQTPTPSPIAEHWVAYSIAADLVSYPMEMA